MAFVLIVNRCREDAVVADGTEGRREVPVQGSSSFKPPSDVEPGTPVGSCSLGTYAVCRCCQDPLSTGVVTPGRRCHRYSRFFLFRNVARLLRYPSKAAAPLGVSLYSV